VGFGYITKMVPNMQKRIIGENQVKMGFRIVVTAYAVQGDIDASDAESSLVALIKK